MNQNFITNLKIEKVRHLENINIALSSNERKHLILTGKNGSGKTSLLQSIQNYLSMYPEGKTLAGLIKEVEYWEKAIDGLVIKNEDDKLKQIQNKEGYDYRKSQYCKYTSGIILDIISEADIIESYNKGEFIIAYYRADRNYKALEAKHIEKISFQDKYAINEEPGKLLIKYLLDLKTSQALNEKANKKEKSNEIEMWFNKFENLLKELFEDEKLTIDFDIESFEFSIIASNREPFGFNTMSSGYSAVLDIIVDLMMRMEKNARGFYNIQGVVLIDEIETHLHLELQKKILPFLISFFPNIQFIVTTHSPFILNSADNVIIFDLENKISVQNGLKHLPYAGVVEGYFEVDTLSDELKEKFNRYKELSKKALLEESDYDELADLERYLDEIPDYLALDISTEYSKLKLEFENRG